MSRPRRLWILLVLIGSIWALGAPGAASAHSEIVVESPAPGSGLAQGPAVVIIKFSEPLNLSVSQIEVLDAGGTEVGQGPTIAVEGDRLAMRRKLGLLPTGQYTVRWTAVSTLDGHSLRGSYSFAVGTGASSDSSVADGPLDSEGPLGVLGRLAAIVALGTWLAAGLLRRPAREAELDVRRTTALDWAAPAIALLGTATSVASSALVATGSLAGIGGLLTSTSGEMRVVVLATTAVGLLTARRWRVLGTVLAGTAILAEAAAGHAASSILPALAVPSFAIHLAAVGIWTYAIVASLLAAPNLRRALATFTPYAIGAGVATAATGVLNAVLMLSDPADLFKTGYGLAIVAKSVAFLLMAAFGLLHFVWRRRSQVRDSVVRLPLRAEAGAALVALSLATLLVGFPNPPREVAASERSLHTNDPELTELRGRDALSLADASGPFVVGLTILPPRPGTADIRVQVLGVEAGDGLRNARFTATGGGPVAVTLEPGCGLGCFAGQATFNAAGDWRVEVQIDSNRGPIALAETVPLPTPDASAALSRAVDAIARLKTARLTELLRGSVDGPTFLSTYAFQAPDRVEIMTSAFTQIIIGLESFRRTGPGAWQKSPFPSPGFSWPAGFYDEFWKGAVAIRLLGTETVDGVPCDVLAFLRPDVPSWFRVWVGISDGLIRRQQMRSAGHIMEHSYADLNAPMSVAPPP